MFVARHEVPGVAVWAFENRFSLHPGGTRDSSPAIYRRATVICPSGTRSGRRLRPQALNTYDGLFTRGADTSHSSAACAAARRAIGTLNGLQLT